MKTLYEKIKRGKEAIARAKAEGRETTEWERHLAKLEQKKAIQDRLFQYLCNRVAIFSYNGDRAKLKAFWAEADKINEMADKVVEGRASFEEWKTLIDEWVSYMDNSQKCLTPCTDSYTMKFHPLTKRLVRFCKKNSRFCMLLDLS